MAGNRGAATSNSSPNGHGMNGRNDAAAPAGESSPPYRVSVSGQFLVMSFVASILLAFGAGQAARIVLMGGNNSGTAATTTTISQEPQLPPLLMIPGKEVPHTVYTSKNFDTAASATSSSLLVRRTQESSSKTAQEEAETTCRASGGTCENRDADEEEEHLPAGQHLLVDMKNLDGPFLDSEERLAHAMVETVAQAKLTLLSYHCHSMVPKGVSCVGVLLESHISFHTWPDEGVITLDLFTCGNSPLMPILPIIERLFGVPRSRDVPPGIMWSHKLRGFRPNPSKNPLAHPDLGDLILGNKDMDMKKEIVSVQTEYQRIDVYDMILPPYRTIRDYQKSISNDGSYHSRHADLYLPDRVIFLDGVEQSSRYGDAEYHEALVHPAMLAHTYPQRVALIGGGEGASLREVLKHATVQQAVMIEIDEMMVNVSRQYLPDWNDCSDLVDSADMCGDDPRATVYYEDALAWFIDRFYESDHVKANAKGLPNDEKFDVIIMDALDPSDDVVFSQQLYDNVIFVHALYNALSDDGILVMQLGESPDSYQAAEMDSIDKNRAIMTNRIQEIGFESTHVYEEAHAGFHGAWNFLVAFKDYTTRSSWYANQAEIELEIHSRAMRTKSGKSPFRYFDGATMMSYQNPHRSVENVFCRQHPMPDECEYLRGFDPYLSNAPASSFEIKTSGVGALAGQGVFSKLDIKEDTFTTLEETVHELHFEPSTFDLMTELEEEYEEARALEILDDYMSAYGFPSLVHGEPEVFVGSGIMTFANHGCNGTHNVDADFSYNVHMGARRSCPKGLTEFTADVDHMPECFNGKVISERSGFSAVVDRHLPQLMSTDSFERDVQAGEEVLENYLAFVGNEEDWHDDILQLRELCSE